MRLEELSEKSVLKYVVISLLIIMLTTIIVVISLNFETLKNNFYDKQVETLTIIPPNENDILRIVGLEPAVKGLSELGGCVANAASNSNYFSNSFAATYGIIPGSFLASKLSGEFKIRMPKNPVRLVQSFGGGLLMGYGAGLAIGCTLGSFFSAIPSMSLSGWLFGLSLAIGAFFGTKIISRF